MKTYLVTGGAGFIGSNLVDKLLKNGHKIIVIDDFSSGKEENLAAHQNDTNLTVCRRNICDNLDDIFTKEKPDAVFHLAAILQVQRSIKNPTESHEVNINGTFNLLDCCRKFNIKKFIFSSSCAIYGNQKTCPFTENLNPNLMSPYALHKVTGEYYTKLFYFLYKIQTISLRYFNVYGPRQNPDGTYASLIPKFIKMINQEINPIINGDGNQTRDFVYVEDVANANIAAAETRNEKCFGEVFNIGGGRNYSVNDVTELILKLSHKNLSPIHCPAVIEPHDTLADTSKAKELLNWEPKTSFENGLKETFEYFSQ